MNSSAAQALPFPSFASITGPMLLGHLLNYALMGILAVQVYIYILSFPKDPTPIKAMVYLVLFIDILQTCFASHYAWYVMAEGWGNPLALRFTPWSLATVPPLAGSVALIGQLFFSWRIWTLSQGNKFYIPVVALIVTTAIGSCAVAFYAGILSGSLRDVAKAADLDPSVTGWLSTSMACDILITLTLVIQLSARKNRGFGSLNHIVHRAMRMSIETGAITSAAVTVELILFLQSNLTSWYFLLGLIVGKLYSNSLMANLNSRSILFRNNGAGEESGVHVWKSTRPLDIRVDTQTSMAISGDPRTRKDIELGSIDATKPSRDMTSSW